MRIPWSLPVSIQKRRLEVLAGRVNCPIRGEIDVERCIACSMLVGCERTMGGLSVTCRPVASREPAGLPYPF